MERSYRDEMKKNLDNVLAMYKKPTYIEEYGSETEDDTPIETEKENVAKLKDVKEVMGKISKTMYTDMHQNIHDSAEYINANKEEIYVDIMTYITYMVDISNDLIFKLFFFLQKKILGEDNNISTILQNTFNNIYDFTKKQTKKIPTTSRAEMYTAYCKLPLSERSDFLKKHLLQLGKIVPNKAIEFHEYMEIVYN